MKQKTLQNLIIARISPIGGGLTKGKNSCYKRIYASCNSDFCNFINVLRALRGDYIRSFLFCRIDFGEINLFHRFVLRNFIYDLY